MDPKIIEAFLEPLKDKSVYDLAIWFEKLRTVVLDGHNIDEEKVSALSEFWEWLHNLNEDTEVTSFFSEEDKPRLIENCKVLYSPKFRNARLALARSFPHYWLKPGKRDGYICIDSLIYGHYERDSFVTRMIQNNVRKFAVEYGNALTERIKHAESEKYREKMDELICRWVQETYNVVFSTSDIESKKQYEKMTPEELIRKLPRMAQDVIYENPATKKKLFPPKKLDGTTLPGKERNRKQTLAEYGITPQGKKNYIDGEKYVEKPFMVRLSLYLGLDDYWAALLLLKEGYALKGSARKWDKIILEALTFGWERKDIDNELKRSGFKPLFEKT